VHPNPGDEFGVGQFAGGHGECHDYGLGVTGGEGEAIQAQEEFQGDEGGALVGVDEGVVAGDRQSIDGGQFDGVGFVVAGSVERPSEGAVEKARVTQAGGASVFRQLFVVDGEDEFAR
jgi:hypothetical protein